VSCRDDIEVIWRAIVLVVLGTSQEFLVVHVPEVRSLNGVVGIKSIGDSMLTVVVSTSCYLYFVSYAVVLASFCSIAFDWRRLSSCIVPWVWGSVSMYVGSISCVVGGVASAIGRSISYKVVRSVSCSVGSGVDRLHYFFFASSLFSHRVEGPLAATSLARTFRSTPGVGTCYGSAVSRTSFFALGSGDADLGLKTAYRRRVFKVV
jgi:hypothetical protein